MGFLLHLQISGNSLDPLVQPRAWAQAKLRQVGRGVCGCILAFSLALHEEWVKIKSRKVSCS